MFNSSKILKFLVVFALLPALFLVGCGNNTDSGNNDASGNNENATESSEPITITLATELPSENVQMKAIHYFAEEVEKRSDGNIVIDIYDGGALMVQQDMYEGLQNNVVDAVLIALPYISGSIPELNALGYEGAYDLDTFVEIQKEGQEVLDEIFASRAFCIK